MRVSNPGPEPCVFKFVCQACLTCVKLTCPWAPKARSYHLRHKLNSDVCQHSLPPARFSKPFSTSGNPRLQRHSNQIKTEQRKISNWNPGRLSAGVVSRLLHRVLGSSSSPRTIPPPSSLLSDSKQLWKWGLVLFPFSQLNNSEGGNTQFFCKLGKRICLHFFPFNNNSEAANDIFFPPLSSHKPSILHRAGAGREILHRFTAFQTARRRLKQLSNGSCHKTCNYRIRYGEHHNGVFV